jgi:hypothetical protein
MDDAAGGAPRQRRGGGGTRMDWAAHTQKQTIKTPKFKQLHPPPPRRRSASPSAKSVQSFLTSFPQ